MSKLKDKFLLKSNEEKALWMLLTATAFLMLFFMICRLCGLLYFTNNYPEHDCSLILQQLILFILSFIEYWLFAMILSTAKWWICLIVALGYNCLFFIPMPSIMPIILDYVYAMFVGFFLNKFDYKRITYGILFSIAITAYQFIMILGRYTIDLNLRFNYVAMIFSVLDYKLFIVNIYLIIKIRRKQNYERKFGKETSSGSGTEE